MGASDRAGILLDSYNLVKAGMMKPGDLVKLLSSYVSEDDATVWEALGGGEKLPAARSSHQEHSTIN